MRGLRPSPRLPRMSWAMASFGMTPPDVAALRRRPGPVPEGWSRVPASLLRYADEQTIAGTAAVFTAIEAMGSSPDRFPRLGRRGRLAVPGSGQSGRRIAQFHERGCLGHVAAFDPPLCLAFSIRNDQPGAGLAWTQPGGWRRAPWRGGRVSGGAHVVVFRCCSRRVAGLFRMVTGARARSEPEKRHTMANAWLWPWPWWARRSRRRRPGSGRSLVPTRSHVRSPLDLAWLAERLRSPGERSTATTIATDCAGRMHIELAGESDESE